MDAFGDIMRGLLTIAWLVFLVLLMALGLSIAGCLYMRAHFEADLKKLRDANKPRPAEVWVDEDPSKPLTEEEFRQLQESLRKKSSPTPKEAN